MPGNFCKLLTVNNNTKLDYQTAEQSQEIVIHRNSGLVPCSRRGAQGCGKGHGSLFAGDPHVNLV